MSSPLPDLMDPWRAADNRSDFVGRLPLSSLPRLRRLLLEEAGDVSFRLAFSRDDEHRALLRCEVSAIVVLPCQRCLEAMTHSVSAKVTLALVSSMDEERRLPPHYDPLMAGDVPIAPADVIEDELLLGLPQIAAHEQGVCGEGLADCQGDGAPAEATSPFAVLAQLKSDR